MERIIVKKGKDKAIKNRHHWIFSGAIAKAPDYQDGDLLEVWNDSNEFLGCGCFNSRTQIAGRMLTFDREPVHDAIHRLILQAISFRREWFKKSETNAYRLINGEGDFLPGLIVDCYDDCLVVQISTLGMDRLKPLIVDILTKELTPRLIFEKSNQPARKEEGLLDFQGTLTGEPAAEVLVRENNLQFIVSWQEGQKTGFFLDHREMRQLIKEHAMGKKVLNAFSYTGGFTLAALAGGASFVDSVDISRQAIELARRNAVLNGFSEESCGFYVEDVFQFLRNHPLDYGIVVLDPPAFAKKKKDIIAGCRGYKDINRVALSKMPKGSLLLTCSCSYYVDEALFQKVVFQAAVEAGRSVRIIGKHHLAADHPINICHPEGDYLKSLLLYVQ